MSVLSFLKRAIVTPQAAPAQTPSMGDVDPVSAIISKHVKIIDRNSQSISDIERALHQEIGELHARRDETERQHRNRLAAIDREIKSKKAAAHRQISLRRKLINSSEAALAPLQAEDTRPVEKSVIPITRHTDIRS